MEKKTRKEGEVIEGPIRRKRKIPQDHNHVNNSVKNKQTNRQTNKWGS